MTIKEYACKNGGRLTNGNMLLYMGGKGNRAVEFALYRHLDGGAIHVYQNCITTPPLEECHMATYTEVDEGRFLEIPRSEWGRYYKQSVRDSINKKDANYQSIREEVEMNGGRLVRSGGKLLMLIGVTSTDEDYYYLLAGEMCGGIHLEHHTCCGRLDYVVKEDYGVEGDRLIRFIQGNTRKIMDMAGNLEYDVMITKFKFDENGWHHRKHKPNALKEALAFYRSVLGIKDGLADELERELRLLADTKTTCLVVSLLDRFAHEYAAHFKPLEKDMKNYYREFFGNKLNDLTMRGVRCIPDMKVRQRVAALCNVTRKKLLLFNKI